MSNGTLNQNLLTYIFSKIKNWVNPPDKSFEFTNAPTVGGKSLTTTDDAHLAASMAVSDHVSGDAHDERYAPILDPTFKGSVSMGRIATSTVGTNSVATGSNLTASGSYSHAEGQSNTASAIDAHAEGYSTVSSGYAAHAEGRSTTASGNGAHAEGTQTQAYGDSSHAEGEGTYANSCAQHVEGQYNLVSGSDSKYSRGDYVHIVGNGTSYEDRSNAHTLDWEGNAWFAGDISIGGTERGVDDAFEITLGETEPMEIDKVYKPAGSTTIQPVLAGLALSNAVLMNVNDTDNTSAIVMNKPLFMNQQNIRSVADPVTGLDAANKYYVDSKVGSHTHTGYLSTSGGTMTNAINFSRSGLFATGNIGWLKPSSIGYDVTEEGYVVATNPGSSMFALKSSNDVLFEANICMHNHTIGALATPTRAFDAANKKYVDDVIASTKSKATVVSVTLPASSWNSSSKTIGVTVSGVTSNNLVIPSPDPDCLLDAGAAGVYCTAQADNLLTFTCSTVPTVDLLYNVVIQEV